MHEISHDDGRLSCRLFLLSTGSQEAERERRGGGEEPMPALVPREALDEAL